MMQIKIRDWFHRAVARGGDLDVQDQDPKTQDQDQDNKKHHQERINYIWQNYTM